MAIDPLPAAARQPGAGKGLIVNHKQPTFMGAMVIDPLPAAARQPGAGKGLIVNHKQPTFMGAMAIDPLTAVAHGLVPGQAWGQALIVNNLRLTV